MCSAAWLVRWDEKDALRLTIGAKHDTPLRVAVFECYVVHVGSSRTYRFESHRLKCTKLSDHTYQLRQLLPGYGGELRAHQIVIRFAALQFQNRAA